MKSAVPKKKNNVQSLNEYTSTLSELFGDNLKVRNHIPKMVKVDGHVLELFRKK